MHYVTRARPLLAVAVLALCAIPLFPSPAQAAPSTHVAGLDTRYPSTVARINSVARAYFAAMVAGHAREVYDLLAPCAATIKLNQGMMGLPARGPYQPGAPMRVRAATIRSVRLVPNSLLVGTGLVEAAVDGTFSFRRLYPGNEERPDGRHVIPIVFTHCGGRWRLYEPWGGGGPFVTGRHRPYVGRGVFYTARP